MADVQASRADVEKFLTAVRKGWRTVAVNVLNSVQSLRPDEPVDRDLVLNLKSVTEQLEREMRVLEEAHPPGQAALDLPDLPVPTDPLDGLRLCLGDEAA